MGPLSTWRGPQQWIPSYIPGSYTFIDGIWYAWKKLQTNIGVLVQAVGNVPKYNMKLKSLLFDSMQNCQPF